MVIQIKQSKELKDNFTKMNYPSEEFWDYLNKNLIYCEDTYSFTHRLLDKFKEGNKKCKNRIVMGEAMPYCCKDAQVDAWKVIDEMSIEFEKESRKSSQKHLNTKTL